MENLFLLKHGKHIVEELAYIQFYHQEPRNIALHYLSTPLFFFGCILMPLAYALPVINDISLAHLVPALYLVIFATWDVSVAAIWTGILSIELAVCHFLLSVGNPEVTVIATFAATFVVTWILSYMFGYVCYEIRVPNHDVYSRFVGTPFYLVMLALFSFGYKADLREQVNTATKEQYLNFFSRKFPQGTRFTTKSGLVGFKNMTVTNWAQNIEITPEARFFPRDLSQVREIIQMARDNNKKIAMIGEGHSWSPVAKTTGYLIDIRMLRSIQVNKEKRLATIEPGVSIAELDCELAKHDLCIPTNVVLTSVRYGGVIATGCHGAGATNTPLSDLVVGITLVTSEGEVQRYTEKEIDMLNAARVSLGTMGFVLEMTFKVEEMYNLKMIDRRVDMDVHMKDPEVLKKLVTTDYHMVELFWFPFSDSMWLKSWDKTEEPTTLTYFRQSLLDVRQCCETFFGIWWYSMVMLRFAGTTDKLVPVITKPVGQYSNMVGKAPAMVHYRKFIEDGVCYNTEFAFKADPDFKNICHAWNMIVGLIEKKRQLKQFPVNLCLEMRVTKNSNAFLSPSVGDEGDVFCYIEVISYVGTPGYMDAAKEIALEMMKLGGKPHWAKLWQVVPDDHMFPYLRKAYGDNMTKFLRLRDEVDPTRTFLNPYMEKLFYGQKRVTDPILGQTTDDIVHPDATPKRK